jgi:glucose-1-phosphate thymidylyltransferase
VIQEEALGQAHAVWLCRDYLDDEDVLVAFGDAVIDADYQAMPAADADAVFLVQEVEDPRRFGVVALDERGYVTRFIEKPPTLEHRLAIAGVYWFRSGARLAQALDRVIAEQRQTLGEYFLADAFNVMLEEGARLKTMALDQWADAGTPEAIISTNARLLSVGYASQDALERSLAEGFTVVPPVYIHPTATIDAAVIGPYATLDAGVVVRNAVVRNSIVDIGATIEDCVLENSLIGEKAVVAGRGKALFVGDNSKVEVG